jgi:hypothetical protein
MSSCRFSQTNTPMTENIFEQPRSYCKHSMCLCFVIISSDILLAQYCIHPMRALKGLFLTISSDIMLLPFCCHPLGAHEGRFETISSDIMLAQYCIHPLGAHEGSAVRNVMTLNFDSADRRSTLGS